MLKALILAAFRYRALAVERMTACFNTAAAPAGNLVLAACAVQSAA